MAQNTRLPFIIDQVTRPEPVSWLTKVLTLAVFTKKELGNGKLLDH